MITTRDMERLLSLHAQVYNIVIIDTPTILNDTVLAFLDASDAILHLADLRLDHDPQQPGDGRTFAGDWLRGRQVSATCSTGPTRRAA